MDLVEGGRVGEAQVGLRLVVAEVAAGDGGHAGLVEEAAGEAHAVGITFVGAGVDIEGALRRHRYAEAGGPQAFEEDVAPGGEGPAALVDDGGTRMYAFNNGTSTVRVPRLEAWSMRRAQVNKG